MRASRPPSPAAPRAAKVRGWPGLLALLAVLPGPGPLGCQSPEETDFTRARAAFRSQLVEHRQAPSAYDPLLPVEWLETFEYTSGELRLKGYRAYPENAALSRAGRAPALVYLHGGFALARQDMLDVLEFLRAGFVVYAPAYRGENGNPGHYELFYGELEDARAAVRAAAADPRVDPAGLLVLGHSAGGVLASLLSLDGSLPALETASVGGIYTGQVFDFLVLPFRDAPAERRVRLFLPHMTSMKKPHFACVGKDDSALDATRLGALTAKGRELPYEMATVEGDHESSLAPCVELYRTRALGLIGAARAR
jgi:hypothetical protein